MLDLTSKTLILIFLVTSMLSVGLQVNLKELIIVFKTKNLLIRSLAANFIVIPLLGLLLAKIVPMSKETLLAFILLACTPGGLSAIQFTTKVKGEIAYAGEITFILSVLAIFISPLLIMLFLPQGISLVIPYLKAFWFLVIFLLLPLILGIVIHNKIDVIAKKLVKPMAVVGTLAFVGMIISTLGLRQQAISLQDIEILGLMLLFIIFSMLIGWIMGGPKKATRQILAIASSMRNVALCLVIVMQTLPDAKIEVPLIAFSALMIPPNLIFTIFSLLKGKRKTKEV